MSSSHTCSQCGINGHNSRTCAESNGGGGGGNGIMLFGVRLTEGSSSSSCSAASASASFSSSAFRKSVSMNNLSQFDHDQHQQQHDPNANVDAGYASDDIVHASGRSKERKRGVPWTEEEHKLFLLGLQKVGKGDWRGISRNFVKTRTPTQVASHAQKYFLRRNNQNRRRRRSSLFDITTDTVMASSMEEDQESGSASQMGGFGMSAFPVALSPVVSPVVSEKPKLVRPMPSIPMPPSTKMANLNLNQKSPEDCLPLSLKLSTPSSEEKGSPKAFDKINGSGDSIVGVA